jgi:amino acid adenylation domain-containing protein
MDISRSAERNMAQAPPPSSLRTFVDLCRWQSERLLDQPAFSHLADDGVTERHLSYTQWDQRIRAIAAVLGEQGKPGDRVLIVQQPGIEYVASLFACMYAGMVAVPVYPPDLFRLRQTLPRLQAITKDAEASIMLSSRDVLGDSVGPMWSLVGERALATEEIDDTWADQFRAPSVRAGDLALLQFTSGSTGTPRGVALTHANIMANAQQGFYAFDVPDAVCVFWLPPYHDLGLIGGMLIPVYGGRRSVLMSPIAFLQQPLRWFEAIHRFRGTTTASPNFGYEWCLRKISLEQCEGLDLSSWKLAAVGAEPVRAGTLQRFAERFSAIGFLYSAFTPGYGMAEATLAITSKPIESSPVVRHFDAVGLHAESPVAVPCDQPTSDSQGRSVALVSSGQPVRDCEVRIVDPVTRQLLPDGHVGEIWVSSPAVAREYWRRPELSVVTFNVKIDHQTKSGVEDEAYLRTGDLGFLLENELFVSGRLKEQIIIAGRNYFPHDIENAIQASHEAFKIDGGIAFSIDHPEGERLVIVHEVLRPKRFDLDQLSEHLRQTVYEETGIVPYAICLVTAASLPKTSSGKLRRLECRRQYLDGELQIISRWESTEGLLSIPSNLTPVPETAFSSAPSEDAKLWSNTERRLAPLWCEALEIKQAARAQHFLEVGGHSLGANQLLSRIRDEFKTNLTLSDLARAPRFGELAAEIERRLDRPDPQSAASETPTQFPAREMPLTQSQSRFWVLDQLQRRDAFLYVGVDYGIDGPLDVERLRACVRVLPMRHEALRVAFGTSTAGEPQQIIHEHFELDADYLDISSQTKGNVARILEELVQSEFELDQAPLVKVLIVKIASDQHHLLIAAHHIVVDGWSMGLLIEDLGQLYSSSFTDLTQAPAGSSTWSLSISRKLSEQQQTVTSETVEYWRSRFSAIPHECSLELPFNSASRIGYSLENTNASQAGRSEVIRVRLPLTLSGNLVQTAKQLGVTPFSIIVSTWRDVLSRYRESGDFLFGIPVANRKVRDEETLVGCFIDVLPFRVTAHSQSSSLENAERLDQQIRAVNQWLMDDISHLSLSTEDILRDSMQGFERHWPLVQHLILQQPALREEVCFGQARVTNYASDYSSLAAYETTLVTEIHDQTLELALAYSPSKIDTVIANNILESLVSAIEQVSQFASEGGLRWQHLQLPASHELSRVRKRLSGPPATSVGSSLMRMFAAQVAATPDSKAIEDQHGAMTFAQLDRLSAAIAAWLTDRKFGAGSRIGVLMTRSTRLPAVLLGIWKAGAAYVPLDPQLPTARLRAIISEAALDTILVDPQAEEAIFDIPTACSIIQIHRIESESADWFAATDSAIAAGFLAKHIVVQPQNAAYLIFTSGSTGRPKGVVVEHRNVTNFLESMARRPGLRSGERLLASTTVTFDISVLELFLPLSVGATCVLTPTSLSDDADAVLEFITSRRIDVLQSTPSSLRLLLALGWKPPARIRIWAGGEAMPVDLADHLLAEGAELWNMYGPTETTVWSTVGRITAAHGGRMTIGEPINGTTLRLVDASGRDVPEGVAGELWIGGDGVARGYWNQAELSHNKFVLHRTPSSTKELRFYKTGDIARLNGSGHLEVLGRVDRQIKLLGHRIELDEIETAILRHPRVREAAVTLLSHGADKSIVAFYTTIGDQPLPADSIRQRLRDELPEVMIPTSIVPLASLPLTPAGKIDYKVLPTDQCVIRTGTLASNGAQIPLNSVVGQSVQHAALPESAVERELARIWQEVLTHGGVALDDHFFRMGGHSLKAAQVIARVRRQFGITVPLKELYANPTLREFAAVIGNLVGGEEIQSVEAAAIHVAEKIAGTVQQQMVAAELSLDDQPLSFAEQRLWFVDRLEPNHPFYNLPLAAEVRGPLDIELLRASFADVVARHETLRSTYRLVDGKPVREIAANIDVVVDLRDLSGQAWSKQLGVEFGQNSALQLEDLLQQEARRPFDLQSAPLVRVTAFRVSAERHVILLVMHHIISDGWSMAVMLGELAEAYHARRQGIPNRLPPLEISYRQFAAEQRSRLTDGAIEPSLQFWREQLKGCTETIDLPTDFDRPPVQDFDGATFPIELPEDLTAEVDRIAKAYEATPFMVMLAAYGTLLSRLSGQDDFNVGTAVANRTDANLESLIGFFVGTIVLRLKTAGDLSFTDFLEQVRGTTIDAFEHAELPFEKLVEEMAGKRDRSHAPLFQTAIVMQNTPRDFAAASGLELTPKHVDNGTAKYDLTLFLWEQDGRLTGHFEYRTRLFLPETISRFAECFKELLRSIASDPRARLSELSILTQAQREQVVRRSIGVRVESAGPETLHELVEASVSQFPDRPAVQDGDVCWSYRELFDRSVCLARGLQLSGVELETPVLLYMQRSADQIAMQLAVLLAGGKFIPVDVTTPPSRIQVILADADCRHVVVAEESWELATVSFPTVRLNTPGSLSSMHDGNWQRPEVSPANLAYIIFTSGSTGKPKGVLIEHAAICNFLRAFCERVELTEHDRFLNNFSPSFDGTLSQTFTALAIGASIVVVNNEVMHDPVRLTEIINNRGVTFAACTPTMFAALDADQVRCMRKVLSAGEMLSPEAAQPWMKNHHLYNGYGPTECTIGCAIHKIEPGFGRTPPIGRPLHNMSMYVLDRHRNIVPDGVIGDVYIGGDSVGRGYLGMPEQTDARFVHDPFIASQTAQPGRMYMTGDLGRWNKDGYMEILGRGDNQIKLRGFRIEPGEIAAAMEQLPEVKTAAVIAWGDTNANGAGPRLVGYFVPEASAVDQSNAHADAAKQMEQTHIQSWRKLFDESHQQAGLVLTPEDDFSGWQSVITGQLIPMELMREWADQSAARIRKLSPKRLLEIGCGTGLILLRVTNAFEQYQGIDVLPSSVEQLQRTVSERAELQGRVSAQVGLADQLGSLPDGLYDTIVLNSVVQYFPSVEYLLKVLRGAVDRLSVGGKIFLGDLRDLRLHGAFATEVELARTANESLTVAKLRRRIMSRMEHDEELLLEPSMFEHLQAVLPRLKHYEVLFKNGSDKNELNRYRFDVILHFDEYHKDVEATEVKLREPQIERDGRLRREWFVWNLLKRADGNTSVDAVLQQTDQLLQAHGSWEALQVAAEQQGIELDTIASCSESGRLETWGNNPLYRRKSLELVTRMRDQLRERLPEYMVPSAFVALEQMPLTVQGKLDKAALPPPPAARPEWAGSWKSPRDEFETMLVEIWEDLLEVDPVGIEDDFFDLGGHSMLAVRMMSEVERRTGTVLPLATLFQKATIEHLAKLLREPDSATPASAVIPLAVGGKGAPIFCIHPAGGTVFCYRPLAELLHNQRPVFGLQARGVDGREQPHQSLNEMAEYYAKAIQQTSPDGPYHLVGWSLGGNIAYEVAGQLVAGGKEIGSLTLLDSGLISESEPLKEADFLPLIAALFPGGEHLPLEELREKSTQEQVDYFIQQASQAGIVPTDAGLLGAQIFRVFQANIKAVHSHRTSRFEGRIRLVRPADQARTGSLFDDQSLGWSELVSEVEVLEVPGDHAGMLRSPAVEQVAKIIDAGVQ